MKFTIQTDALAAALRIASVATMSGRSTLPILGNIKIEAMDEEIALTTTNLDLYVIQKIPAKVAQVGVTTVAFSLLSQLVTQMESKEIGITLNKKMLEFKSGDFHAPAIETLDASEFPGPLPQNRDAKVSCEAEEIMRPFSLLAHAIHDSDQRYLLQGINLSPSKDGTEFAATNGVRLVFYRGAGITKDNVIIPEAFVKAILKIDPKGDAQCIISDGVITIIAEGFEISSKLIEGNFPNWRKIVPDRSDKAFGCGRKPLIAALQKCAIFVKPQTPGIEIRGKGKEIEVSQPGKATAMILGTELAGQPDMAIRLDAFFLIQTLGVFEGDNIRIQLKDADSPILIEEGPLSAVINRLKMVEK